MGCCETLGCKYKQKSPSDIPEDIQYFSVIVQESNAIGIPKYSSLVDEKAKEIIMEIENLDRVDDWETVKSGPVASIRKRLGSSYSKDFLVSRLQFNFGKIVSVGLILEELNIDIKRKKWDKYMSVIENIDSQPPSYYLLYSILSILGFKTEYLERKIVFEKSGLIFVVVYSVEDDRKPIETMNRAFTFFGVIVIAERDMKTDITVYNQTNPNSALLKMGTGLGILKLSDWAKCFTKHINKILEA